MTRPRLLVEPCERDGAPGLRLPRRAAFRLQLHVSGEIVGLGEVAPLPAFGSETPEAAARALAAAQAGLGAWRELGAILESPPGGAMTAVQDWLASQALRRFSATRSGLETCFLDALARRHGMPLHRLLGGGGRTSVPLNALATGPDYLEDARSAVTAGFRTVKVKVGSLPAGEALGVLRNLRKHLGPGVRLRADAARAWSQESALAFLRDAADLALEYVEEPTADLPALLALGPGAPVAADESACPAPRAWRWLARPVIPPVFVLKPALFGGLVEARRFALAARGRGVRVVVTSALEGEIGHLAAAHLACSLPEELPDCGLAGIAADGGPAGRWVIRGGELRLSPDPGLGLEARLSC